MGEAVNTIKVADNLAAIRDRVAAACLKAGRPGDAVRLVAVSKRIAMPLVVQAVAAGQLDLGENRLPEAVDRQSELSEALVQAKLVVPEVSWHFIGHIQSRKAAQTVGMFTLLHGVDSVKLARKLSGACVAAGVKQRILLEVNVTGEQQKDGLAPDDLASSLGQISQLPGLEIQGLMCMARFGADDAELHRTFAALRELAGTSQRELNLPLPELSMGMSGDFEIAIAEGATIIRVGSAIFGPRNT
jgi:hypothetical protein